MPIKGRDSYQRGVVVLELALLILFLVSVMALYVNLGAAWNIKHRMENAAREGARFASLTSNLQVNDPRILDIMDGILQPQSGRMIAQISPDTYRRSISFVPPLHMGDPIRVQVSLSLQQIAPFRLLSQRGRPIALAAQSEARYEQFN